MKTFIAPAFYALSVQLLSGCAPSVGGPRTADDVKCPQGQTFDGQFCRVDQNVASAETPLVSTSIGSESDKKVLGSESVAADSEDSALKGASSGEVVETENNSKAPEGEPATSTPNGVAEPVLEQQEPVQAQKASPVDITMATQAAPIIQYLASSHLPSRARPLGAPFAAQFAQGQVLEQRVQMNEGKCYTVVAVALPPVTELDIELFEEGGEEPLAKDLTRGPQAVLGSRDTCFRPPKTGSYQLVLTVRSGQGVAAAQVFLK